MILVAHRTPATRAGCLALADAGAQLFEADVQVDDADRVVVSHYLPIGRGGWLQRDNWRVRWHGRSVCDPRLTDIVDRVPDGCRVLLDLKERAPERRARLVDALVESLPARERFVVCGSARPDLDELRRAGFATWRTAGDRRELDALVADGALPDEAATIRHSLLDAASVERLRRCTPRVIAWTVNSVRRARQLRSLGVAGVTTDRSAVLQALAGGSH